MHRWRSLLSAALCWGEKKSYQKAFGWAQKREHKKGQKNGCELWDDGEIYESFHDQIFQLFSITSRIWDSAELNWCADSEFYFCSRAWLTTSTKSIVNGRLLRLVIRNEARWKVGGWGFVEAVGYHTMLAILIFLRNRKRKSSKDFKFVASIKSSPPVILNSAPYRGNQPETSRYCRSGRPFPLSLTSTFPTSHSDENRSFPPNFPPKRRENGGVERAISSISSSSNLRPLSIKQTDFSPRGHNYGGKLFSFFPHKSPLRWHNLV